MEEGASHLSSHLTLSVNTGLQLVKTKGRWSEQVSPPTRDPSRTPQEDRNPPDCHPYGTCLALTTTDCRLRLAVSRTSQYRWDLSRGTTAHEGPSPGFQPVLSNALSKGTSQECSGVTGKPQECGQDKKKEKGPPAPKFKRNRESLKIQSGQQLSDAPAWEAWPPSLHGILDKSLDHPGPSPPPL